MFNQFEPNVKALIRYLRILGIKVNAGTVDDTMQKHPDYPTLLSISDALSSWEVPNAAGKIHPDALEQLPLPFLAHIGASDSPLALVTQVENGWVSYERYPYGKTIRSHRAAFNQQWDGIYLFAEPAPQSGERNFAKIRTKRFTRSALGFFLLLSLLIVPAGVLSFQLSGTEGITAGTAAGVLIQFFFLFVGLLVSTALLWYETDKANVALQKVCTSMKKGNCEAVLGSKHAKVLPWLSWSEVGFFYFSGSFLFLLLASSKLVAATQLLAWLGVTALPYILFSVFYQWRVAKQWCVLCLGVQGVLLATFLSNYTFGVLNGFPEISVPLLATIAASFVLPVLTWFTIKPYLVKLVEARSTRRDYLRLKFDPTVFNSLLAKQEAVPMETGNLGISLGNIHSKNKLIKVCNPYCGPCAKAHPAVETLLEEYKDIHVEIIFACNNGEHDRTAIPAKHLLAIDARREPGLMKAALDDWYLSKEKDYEKFRSRYPVNGEVHQQNERLEEMKRWCQSQEIKFTPTFFINGRQLPAGYQVEDLKYFLSE